MLDNKTIRITGLFGLVGTLLVGTGEFFLHYSEYIQGSAQDYQFFAYVPFKHLTVGHFLAVAGVPLYYVGYYHLYAMLGGNGNRLAVVVFILGVMAFTVGGFWITSRGFFGSIIHLQAEIPADTYQKMLDNYTLFSESLLTVLRILVLAVSAAFIAAVVRGGTRYPKWMAMFNPFLLLLVVFAVYFVIPTIGKYLGPIAMNVAHFILFAVSLSQLNALSKGENG